MTPHRAVAIALLTATLAGCADDPPPAPTGTVNSYSCCSAQDVEKAYHPGETVTLHWTVGKADGPLDSAGPELTVRLAGPFGSVDNLKDGAQPSVTLTAAPVHPAASAPSGPVSTIVIPADAPPGYYNLTFSERRGDSSNSGASVVRVVAG